MMKLKLWHLGVGILLVFLISSKTNFLGSILPGQQKDFVFSHFAWSEGEDDKLLWTSNSFSFGSEVLKTSKVGYDGCAEMTIKGKTQTLCSGDSIMLGDNVKIVFNPILKTHMSGYDGG